jgi:hypothetical protein
MPEVNSLRTAGFQLSFEFHRKNGQGTRTEQSRSMRDEALRCGRKKPNKMNARLTAVSGCIKRRAFIERNIGNSVVVF